jgi:hypothetical protein
MILWLLDLNYGCGVVVAADPYGIEGCTDKSLTHDGSQECLISVPNCMVRRSVSAVVVVNAKSSLNGDSGRSSSHMRRIRSIFIVSVRVYLKDETRDIPPLVVFPQQEMFPSLRLAIE